VSETSKREGVRSDVDDASLYCENNRVRAVFRAEFGQKAPHVGLDCFFGNRKLGGKALIGTASGDVSQNRDLALEWSNDLRAIVERAKKVNPQIPGDYLIRTRRCKPYSARGFSAIWQRLMTKYVNAGGTRFSFHDLRAVSADGASTVEEAQARLGHRSSATTQRHYYHSVTRARPRK
jgi:integrase